MKTIRVIDTHTVCPMAADRAAIQGIAPGTKVLINGVEFRTKADKKGGVSEYMLYVENALALGTLLAGASKATPKEISFEVVVPAAQAPAPVQA